MNSPSSRTAAFVKFFQQESHADQFVKGNLYMQRLRYFQQLEAIGADDGRPDAHEAAVSWHQPDRIELKIEMPGFDPIVVTRDDLAGPVYVTRNFFSEMHLFCMSALSIPDPAQLQGEYAGVQAQLQAAFQVDDRCLEFGPFAVIVSAKDFLPKLRDALEKHMGWSKADTVQYYDEKTFHGDFRAEDVPFMKQSKFAYQKEYRVCLQTDLGGNDAIFFDIGDLSSFAIKAKSADLNAALKVTLGRH